jgi:hypothetical protein
MSKTAFASSTARRRATASPPRSRRSPTPTCPRTVTAAIDGLEPDAAYHFRLRASSNKGETLGKRPILHDGSGGTDRIGGPDVHRRPGISDHPSTGDTALMTGASKAVLGESVVVAPLLGTVKTKLPGSTSYATLSTGDSVPVSTVVDTRHGTVKLTSALGTGTPSGEFRGALFQVRQPRTGGGMTDLVLQGSTFASCPSPTARTGPRPTVRAASSATTRKQPLRRLCGRATRTAAFAPTDATASPPSVAPHGSPPTLASARAPPSHRAPWRPRQTSRQDHHRPCRPELPRPQRPLSNPPPAHASQFLLALAKHGPMKVNKLLAQRRIAPTTDDRWPHPTPAVTNSRGAWPLSDRPATTALIGVEPGTDASPAPAERRTPGLPPQNGVLEAAPREPMAARASWCHLS